MTRKDYTKAAKIVASFNYRPYKLAAMAAFIELFQNDSPISLFDVVRFKEACGE